MNSLFLVSNFWPSQATTFTILQEGADRLLGLGHFLVELVDVLAVPFASMGTLDLHSAGQVSGVDGICTIGTYVGVMRLLSTLNGSRNK